jgi:CheY-like chemotaxis protein
MDGLQFIAQARELLPKTSYIMLTGNQDTETAVRAINDGRVFRFLTKPCEVDGIRAAIEAGHAQFELHHAERELLSRTCAGAIALVSEVLETHQPQVCQLVSELPDTVDALRLSVGILERWEYSLAARLSLVGFACLDDDTAQQFMNGSIVDNQWRETYRRATARGAAMIRHIPRFELIAELIEQSDQSNGLHCSTKPSSDAEVVQVGGNLIGVAIAWHVLMSQALDVNDALVELRHRFPELPTACDIPLQSWNSDVSCLPAAVASIGDLRVGMVIRDNLCSKSGDVLVRSGRRLSQTMIENLTHRAATYNDIAEISIVDLNAHRHTEPLCTT